MPLASCCAPCGEASSPPPARAALARGFALLLARRTVARALAATRARSVALAFALAALAGAARGLLDSVLYRVGAQGRDVGGDGQHLALRDRHVLDAQAHA